MVNIAEIIVQIKKFVFRKQLKTYLVDLTVGAITDDFDQFEYSSGILKYKRKTDFKEILVRIHTQLARYENRGVYGISG